MTSRPSIPLSDVPIGASVRVRRLTSRPEVSVRLRELGFCENAVVRCVTKGYGNMICEVYNTRVGLDDGLASGIFVTRFE